MPIKDGFGDVIHDAAKQSFLDNFLGNLTPLSMIISNLQQNTYVSV